MATYGPSFSSHIDRLIDGRYLEAIYLHRGCLHQLRVLFQLSGRRDFLSAPATSPPRPRLRPGHVGARRRGRPRLRLLLRRVGSLMCVERLDNRGLGEAAPPRGASGNGYHALVTRF